MEYLSEKSNMNMQSKENSRTEKFKHALDVSQLGLSV